MIASCLKKYDKVELFTIPINSFTSLSVPVVQLKTNTTNSPTLSITVQHTVSYYRQKDIKLNSTFTNDSRFHLFFLIDRLHLSEKDPTAVTYGNFSLRSTTDLYSKHWNILRIKGCCINRYLRH